MKKYIIFDLEATCWERTKANNKIHEIIEIGAVKLDKDLKQLDTFNTFVRPTKNPILSDFCIDLTSIKQNEVDSAPYFAEAIYNFEKWIGANAEDDMTLMSWGYYDKNQLIKECEVKNYNGKILQFLKQHRNLKHDFTVLKKIKPCGMAKALMMLNIPLEGTHHRGIDDAVNIAKIFKAIH